MNQASVHSTGLGRGSLASYLTGFILALILTAMPFALVMSHALPPLVTLGLVFSAGLVQVLVHLHYFLHLDFSSANRWNLAALMFTVIIMALFVGGSLWILFSLYGRLM